MEGNHGKAHIMLETFCAQNLKTLIDTQIIFVRRHNSRKTHNLWLIQPAWISQLASAYLKLAMVSKTTIKGIKYAICIHPSS